MKTCTVQFPSRSTTWVGSATKRSPHTWLEGRDDGTNGGLADGIPQRVEYQEALFYTYQDENLWTINVTVNDTVNDNREWGRVLLEGTDLAGFSIPEATAADGHARWESRTPSKGTLVSFEPTKNLLSQTMMRFEPSQQVGWKVSVSDANGLGDVAEIRIELGNDESLGVKYTTLDDTCATLDERLLLLPSGCEVSVENDILTVEFTATVQWSMTMAGLIQENSTSSCETSTAPNPLTSARHGCLNGKCESMFNNCWMLRGPFRKH